MKIQLTELSQLLHEVMQIFDAYAMDESWSDYDESVRKRVVDLQKIIVGKEDTLVSETLLNRCINDLVALKRYKDKLGKTEYYTTVQPVIWGLAFDIVEESANVHIVQEIKEFEDWLNSTSMTNTNVPLHIKYKIWKNQTASKKLHP